MRRTRVPADATAPGTILSDPEVLKHAVCKECGGTDIYQRADDTEEIILDRMKTYAEETTPLLEHYAPLITDFEILGHTSETMPRLLQLMHATHGVDIPENKWWVPS